MLDFVFQNATKIIFGKNTELAVGEEVKAFSTNIMLVHYGDEYIKTSGLLTRVTESLKSSGVNYTELTGVKPNPLLGLVYEGIALSREKHIDFILALGGGSVIDTAKAIAAGVPYEGDVWDMFLKKQRCEKALPTGVILTIPATGSESSHGAVITNEKTGYKLDVIDLCLRPKFAILNPELTYTLPEYQTFCGATDMISHVMERYFTPVKNVDLTDRLCEATITSVIKNSRILLEEPHDYNARAELMWASTLAHNDLLSTGRIGDWASHGIGLELSALYNTIHGAALAVILPAWMKYVYKTDVNRFAQFANRIFNIEYDLINLERTARLGIEQFEAFLKEIHMPTRLSDLGIDSSGFAQMAKKAVERGLIGNLKQLGEADVFAILNLAL
ncbi:MAG TPA: iron-containing alcohol dehydrogenase [Clostridia bacterium]|nr:iron-containing alcohol dehydrogenase [Clostridia bacterium]